jgi:hypothetical protein
MVEPSQAQDTAAAKKKEYNPTKKDEVETFELLNMKGRKHRNRATNFLS